MRPKSTCSSSPGSPSATRTVVPWPRRGPHSSAQKRSRVRIGTVTPWRARRVWTFTTVRSSSSSHRIFSAWGSSAPPGQSVAVGAMRAHLLHHQAHEDVVELVLAAVALQAGVHRRLDVAADGLAVHPGQPLDRAQSLAPQPEPEHLSHLEHPHLPEGHRRSLVR